MQYISLKLYILATLFLNTFTDITNMIYTWYIFNYLLLLILNLK